VELTPAHRRILIWSCCGAALILIAMIVTGVAWARFTRKIDAQLDAGPFSHTFNFYAVGEQITPGDQISEDDLVSALRRCTTHGVSFEDGDHQVTVHTGKTGARIHFDKGVVTGLTDLAGGKLADYELPPQMIANLSEDGREKRIMVRYQDLPPVLVQAVISAEDKHFFQHVGLDIPRIAKAAWVDFKDRKKEQGASTLTMQLARNLYLDPDKTWRRKSAECMITLHLEQRLSKKKIFEHYANQVYLGSRGTFHIHGFGQAARAYFNKDVRNLNLPEAALLAGIIQRPSWFNPIRYPERAVERRNLVLMLMRENRWITPAQYEQAAAAPLKLESGATELSETQYFVDLLGDDLQKRLEDRELKGVSNVYTTLDLRLQAAAEKAIRDGMENVDRELARQNKKGATRAAPQVVLIAMDPHTGEIKALCGGRNYSVSQLNRAVSRRPPGSAFKPFVYAAALSSAVEGYGPVFTPSSVVLDQPTVFRFANQTYSPDNFKHGFHGTVTYKQALAKSMNVAAVKVGELVGFDKVVALAKRAGMNEDIRPTPAVALGSYDVTPLEIAGAYTVFANGGMRVSPQMFTTIRDSRDQSVLSGEMETRRVLDPRVTFLMVDMLQEVMRSGTAAGVRSRGFKLPAAGKTGTSHDGWFAGFTSELLCVVWIGYDDYHELGLEGARSALPVWTEFMQEATRYKRYREAKAFPQPAGVLRATVDPTTGLLAMPYCPWVESSWFVAGTEPTSFCELHQEKEQQIVSPVTVLANVIAVH
jgi:penicillin-binding protein 1B